MEFLMNQNNAPGQPSVARGAAPANGATPRRPRPPGPNDVQPSSGKNQPSNNLNNLMRPRPWWISFILILLVNYLLVQVFLPERPQQRIDVPYTFFKQQVSAGNVSDVTSRGDVIQGTFKVAEGYPPDQPNAPKSTQFQTVMPQFADPGLETLLTSQGVTINAHSLDEPRSWWQTLLLSFGPTLLLIGLFFWISSRAANQLGGAGGPFGLGRSRAKRYDQASEGLARITFSDVAGIDEAKQELEEVVDFLRDRGAGHWQDPAGTRRRRRSQRAVLQHGRERVC